MVETLDNEVLCCKTCVLPHMTAAQFAALGNNPCIGFFCLTTDDFKLHYKFAGAVWKTWNLAAV